MLKKVFLVAIALSLPTSVGLAKQRPSQKACASDIKTLCAGVEPGASRINTCRKQHVADFSKPCQAMLSKAAAVTSLTVRSTMRRFLKELRALFVEDCSWRARWVC